MRLFFGFRQIICRKITGKPNYDKTLLFLRIVTLNLDKIDKYDVNFII